MIVLIAIPFPIMKMASKEIVTFDTSKKCTPVIASASHKQLWVLGSSIWGELSRTKIRNGGKKV